MHSKHSLPVLFFVLASILLTGVSAVAAPDVGTIIFKDGEEFRNVSYDVNRLRQVIIIQTLGTEMVIKFDQISSILDRKFRDITDKVLNLPIGTIILKSGEEFRNVGYDVNSIKQLVTIHLLKKDMVVKFDRISRILDRDFRNVTDKTLSLPSKLKLATAGPTWGIALRLACIHSIPSSDYYTGFRAGFGYEGDVIVALSRRVSLRLSLSRSGLRENWTTVSVEADSGRMVKAYLDLNVVQYFVSLQYDPSGDRTLGRRISNYVFIGIGVIEHNGSAAAYGRQYSASETKWANTLGLGVTISMTNRLGFDISMAHHIVYAEVEEGGEWYQPFWDLELAYIFDAKVGLVAYF